MVLTPDWPEIVLPRILGSMRCTPAHATNIIPAELLLNRKVKFPFEVENALEEGEGTSYYL